MAQTLSPTTPPRAPQAGPAKITGPTQLDTFARLQLAAALLEYDHDTTGKLAEHSAIFAPYRDEAPVVDYAADKQAGYDNEDEDVNLAWRTNGHNDTTSRRLSVAAGGADPAVFTDFLGGNDNNALQEEGNAEEEDEGVRDADLASEWGLESVMTKFDNLNPSELKAKTGKRSNARTRKKSRAQSDIFGLTLEGVADTQLDEGTQSEAGDYRRPHMETQSLPDALDYTKLPSRKKGPKQSAGARARKASLASELEQAFSTSEQVDFGDMVDGQEEEEEDIAAAGGRSRSSSMGGMAPSMFSINALAGFDDPEGMEEITASYAAEAVARPPSSMSGYVSRFDPKAIAAQKEEAISTRLRFPNSLHPKILIMPAPLAEYDQSSGLSGANETEPKKEEEPQPKPRIEREAGKLYGKSLMDELNERKIRQKAKQRAFQGDSRRAMTDNLNQRHLVPRAPSPLSGEMGEEESQEEGKPGQPKPKKGGNLDDPWVKYTSHRSLAVLAGNAKEAKAEADTQSPSKRVTTLLSPGHSPHSASPTNPNFPQSRSQAAHLSTAELQAAYKRSSSMPLLPPTPDYDSDDDVPLDTRRTQLTSSASRPVLAKALTSEEPKAMPSVFGQDIVMQRELEKLEKILKIEEAEKKIQAEKERIKEAEREEKDRKKREKAERKAKKRLDKDKKARMAQLQQEEEMRQQQEMQSTSRQEGNEESRQTASEEQRRTVLINHGLLPAEGDQDYQQEQCGELRPERESRMWDPVSGRNSILPFDEDIIEPIRSPGRARSSSFAPSLALSFVPTLGGSPAGDALSGAQNWFGASSSDDSKSEGDDEEREERLPSKSRDGRSRFGEDGEDRVDPSEIWNASGDKQDESDPRPGAERNGSFFDTARKPELKKVERADSFAGVLESFGIGEDADGSDDDAIARKKSGKTNNRISMYGEIDSITDDDEEEEEAPLAKVIARRSQALLSSSTGNKPAGKITLDPPRLDLPTDFSLAESPKKVPGSDGDDSGSEDTPLHVKRLTTALASVSVQQKADQEGSEIEEDDLPLALKRDDEVPLGQKHPMAAMAQQMEYQQQQNQLLVQQMQYQYQMQQQYQYEMQMQQMMAMQQAALQGYPASVTGGYAPSQMGQMLLPVDMSGAASDIGLGVPPDPKLVNSVDRWRQNVQQ